MALWIDYAAAVSAAAQERDPPHTPAASAVPTKLLRVIFMRQLYHFLILPTKFALWYNATRSPKCKKE